MSRGSKLNNSFFDQNVTIFVSGIHSKVTEEILWELFLQAGPLENVRIPKDKETGKQRTFGFVAYQDACSVPYACELFDSLKLFGKPINCKPQNSTCNSPQHIENRSNSPIRMTQDERQQHYPHRELIKPHDSYSSGNVNPHGRPVIGNLTPKQSFLRSVSTGTFSPMMHPLVMQAMYQQHINNSVANWNDSHSSTGPMRRHNSMYDRRPMTSRTQRRQQTHPY